MDRDWLIGSLRDISGLYDSSAGMGISWKNVAKTMAERLQKIIAEVDAYVDAGDIDFTDEGREAYLNNKERYHFFP